MISAWRNWWSSREPRERNLIRIAAILSLVIGFYQFAWVPAEAFRDRSEQAYRTALSDRIFVATASRNVSRDLQTATRNQSVQSVITTTSAYYGLEVSRILPDDRAGLNLWFDRVPSASFYAWTAELERDHAIRIEKATLRQIDEGGAVNANIYVRRLE